MPEKLKNKMQQKNPLISIIIPAYNESKHINKCLQSLFEQTYKNFEVIIVNDGSTDNTATICSKYNLKIINIRHSGPGNAKNIGVNIAKGLILVFIDGDMNLEKNFIYEITKPIINKKCIGTYTTSEFVANTTNIWAKCWNININLNINRRIRYSTKKGKAFRAILKSCFIKTEGFDSKWGYTDDGSLVKYGLFSIPANKAKCYHYNPDSIMDVFLSARWIGRSKEFPLNIQYLLKYSFLNSIRIAYRKINNGAPIFFLLFKIVFDFGILIGLLQKNSNNNYSK